MKHILFELDGCDPTNLDNEDLIKGCLRGAAACANATLLHVYTHKFEPQGVTGFALLAESHISIHTWPEECRAVCDVFTCGGHTEPDEAMQHLQSVLRAQSTNATYMIRQ